MFDFFKGVASGDPLSVWLAAVLTAGVALGLWSGFFQARRIQPGRFKWSTFRNEGMFAVINSAVTAWTLGPLNTFLRERGFIAIQQGPVAWWVIAIEFTAYFFLFDTWFYWLHRGMHKEPFYKWIHKIHHKSTSPNLLTTFSVSPLESLVNGGFLPVFLTVSAVLFGGLHQASVALMVPFTVLMGLYVHSGHEFLPRWWNRTWATKWFITATFHDQHHKYFNYNFGGFTQIWDYLCGTVRKKYESDFENPKGRQKAVVTAATRGPAIEPAQVPQPAA